MRRSRVENMIIYNNLINIKKAFKFTVEECHFTKINVKGKALLSIENDKKQSSNGEIKIKSEFAFVDSTLTDSRMQRMLQATYKTYKIF